MRKDLQEIRYQLQEICKNEANSLFRLARTMERHGVNAEMVARCREEALLLHNTGYPERILDPFKKWEFAFNEEVF